MIYIPAKSFHNRDIVSVHINHFSCMRICDTLKRDSYSKHQQKFKLQISLNYAIIPENVISERVVALKAVDVYLLT